MNQQAAEPGTSTTTRGLPSTQHGMLTSRRKLILSDAAQCWTQPVNLNPLSAPPPTQSGFLSTESDGGPVQLRSNREPRQNIATRIETYLHGYQIMIDRSRRRQGLSPAKAHYGYPRPFPGGFGYIPPKDFFHDSIFVAPYCYVYVPLPILESAPRADSIVSSDEAATIKAPNTKAANTEVSSAEVSDSEDASTDVSNTEAVDGKDANTGPTDSRFGFLKEYDTENDADVSDMSYSNHKRYFSLNPKKRKRRITETGDTARWKPKPDVIFAHYSSEESTVSKEE